MPDTVQNNVLITQDGQACLGDFGFTGAFEPLSFYHYGSRTLRYMAPERLFGYSFGDPKTSGPSRESDVYSLAVTSISVCSPVVNRPTT